MRKFAQLSSADAVYMTNRGTTYNSKVSTPPLEFDPKARRSNKYYFLGKDWLARLCDGSILISAETTNSTTLSFNIALNGAVFVLSQRTGPLLDPDLEHEKIIPN